MTLAPHPNVSPPSRQFRPVALIREAPGRPQRSPASKLESGGPEARFTRYLGVSKLLDQGSSFFRVWLSAGSVRIVQQVHELGFMLSLLPASLIALPETFECCGCFMLVSACFRGCSRSQSLDLILHLAVAWGFILEPGSSRCSFHNETPRRKRYATKTWS